MGKKMSLLLHPIMQLSERSWKYLVEGRSRQAWESFSCNSQNWVENEGKRGRHESLMKKHVEFKMYIKRKKFCVICKRKISLLLLQALYVICSSTEVSGAVLIYHLILFQGFTKFPGRYQKSCCLYAAFSSASHFFSQQWHLPLLPFRLESSLPLVWTI